MEHDYLHEVKLLVAGECGLVVEFGDSISPEIAMLVQQLTRLLAAGKQPGIIEVVPTYRSVMVYFDPLICMRKALSGYISKLIADIEPKKLGKLPARVVKVPVCYGGVLGPDLEYVARFTGLSTDEVIALHTSQTYLVYMLGFTPGFPYLGSLPDKIVVPRKKKPLAKVPAGSVGIAGNQTGVYSSESQGEWWLIGRTPLKFVNLTGSSSFLVSPGDYVQFVAISMEEYFQLRQAVDKGGFLPQIRYASEGDNK